MGQAAGRGGRPSPEGALGAGLGFRMESGRPWVSTRGGEGEMQPPQGAQPRSASRTQGTRWDHGLLHREDPARGEHRLGEGGRLLGGEMPSTPGSPREAPASPHVFRGTPKPEHASSQSMLMMPRGGADSTSPPRRGGSEAQTRAAFSQQHSQDPTRLCLALTPALLTTTRPWGGDLPAPVWPKPLVSAPRDASMGKVSRLCSHSSLPTRRG